jgi:signal transduction histidine kinase
MTALRVVQAIVSLSFLALGLYMVVEWLRQRERSRGYLALALGTLGLTSVLGQVNTLTGYRAGVLLQDVTLVLFMASGYALLLFRDTFIPLSRPIRLGALVLVGISTAFALAVSIPAGTTQPSPLQSAATIALVVVWSACVIEPIVRLWAASRGRPAVQRARLRALGAGYAAIVAILLVAGFGGSSRNSPLVQWLFEIVGIIALPLLLVGFAPPQWLRRIWRQAEIDQLRDAMHELVLFSPDRITLAKRAADWGRRLVGADGVAIIDADHQLLALEGIDAETAARLASKADPVQPAQLVATAERSSRNDAIVLALPLDNGTGAMVVVSGPFTPFFGTDEIGQLRGYATNITAALDRARVTERLAALDKMKSQFLNLASHEMRSPLGVINGYLSILEQGALGQLKESGMRAIEILKTKTLEMNLLVAQMLDAARLEDGQLTLRRDHLDLRRVARDAIQIVHPITGTPHELSLETPATEVPVFGDVDRLITIITNLLENAVKYSPDGGKIRCVVSSDAHATWVRVIDPGVGIAAEDLPRLFNRFERLQNRRTSHVGGTGLGLYLSRELARQHGGDIEVESQPGAGSTFTLTLPLTKPLHATATVDELPLTQPIPAVPHLHVVAPEGESEPRLA